MPQTVFFLEHILGFKVALHSFVIVFLFGVHYSEIVVICSQHRIVFSNLFPFDFHRFKIVFKGFVEVARLSARHTHIVVCLAEIGTVLAERFLHYC